MERYPAYKTFTVEDRFFTNEWNERNKIMADNIIKAAKQYVGKRLVVLTGSEHRYILRDLLKDEPTINLKEYWELVDFDLEKCLKSIGPAPQAGIVADGLTKEQASQKVAKEFWLAVIKGDWEQVNKLRPVSGGKNWKEVYSKNMPVELIEVKEAHWPEQGQSSVPLAPCVVRFEDGKILQIEMVPQFRKISGKMLCFITATWGKDKKIEETKVKDIEPNQSAYLKPIQPDKLKEDLDFLFKTIEEVHPNMYAYTSKEEFELLREQLYKSITDPMNRIEFYKLTAPVVASLKSGHTFIFPPVKEFSEYVKTGGKVLLLSLNWDGEKAILVNNYGPTNLPIGGTILSINGENAAEVINRLARYFPAERRSSFPWQLEKRRTLKALYLA